MLKEKGKRIVLALLTREWITQCSNERNHPKREFSSSFIIISMIHNYKESNIARGNGAYINACNVVYMEYWGPTPTVEWGAQGKKEIYCP